MATFVERIKANLENNGMFEGDASAVVAAFIEGEKDSSMGRRRIYEDTGNYPEGIYNILWAIASRYALKYIDEHQPRAWYRPMFLSPEDQKAWFDKNGVVL